MRRRGEVTNKQWAVLELLLRFPQRPDGRGRPPQGTRAVLKGVLWILRTGEQWRELPAKYPPHQTGHRRVQQWVRKGQLEKALRVLARELHGQGRLDLEEGFIDGSFASAKKGVLAWARASGAKGRRSWPSPLVPVFLWPSTSIVLRPTKASGSRKRWPGASLTNSRRG